MKRLVSLFLSLLTVAFGLLPAVRAAAASPNLVANPSAETSTNGTTPDSWQTGKWGTNNATFTWATTGHTGTRSLKVQMTSYTDGDAKWYFTPVNVTAGSTYNLSEWYHATVPTDLLVQFDNGTNYSYLDLGTKATVTPWTQNTATFTVPAGFTHATVFHVISSIGILQTDDYSVSKAANTTVSVTAPAASSTVSGSAVSLAATATSDNTVAGVQFKVDGTAVGSEVTTAPYQTTWDSTAVANGPHTVTAVVRDADGTLTTSANDAVTVNNPVAAGTNLIPNPGLETVDPANKNMPANWTTSSWGTNNATFRYVTDGVHGGTHAIKVNIGTYTDGDAKWYFTPQAIDSSKMYDFSDYYKSNAESYVVVDFGMSGGTDQYVTLGTLSPSSAYTKFEEQFSVPAGAQTATVFHLMSRVGWVVTDDYSLSSYVPVGFDKARISLTFDDAWASVYQNALPVLDKYGFKSTQYLLTGNTADPNYMNQSMMLALKNDGQEIASHTVDHQDLVTLTAAQQKSELNDSKTSLQTWTGATVTDFASPYGSLDQNALTQVKKYYSSQRGVVAGFNSKNYFNIWDIKVQDVTSTTTVAQIQGWIAQAQATNTWLVLVYHQVSTDPAAGDYNTPPADLDAQFSAIKDSGIAVETVSQALNELKPQL
ncbi:MAG TPA: polysaccharide deacetylase family protein [Candidatus Saccharimonadales bacterium]|nr:polysaccharide deacetylase family protein [Candidatus Saccharimonadales bacterium]